MKSSHARPAASRLDRDTVVETALALLDDYGLPDLSMRRLADALGVRAGALYWHVESKQALLALVADRILDAARMPARTGDWRADTTEHALALRDGLLAYRDGAEVVLSTLALGLGARAMTERMRHALSVGGLDASTADVAADALVQLTLGHAVLVQQRMHADALGVTHPDVAAAPGDDRPDAFAAAVTLVLDGAARRHDRHTTARAGSARRDNG